MAQWTEQDEVQADLMNKIYTATRLIRISLSEGHRASSTYLDAGRYVTRLAMELGRGAITDSEMARLWCAVSDIDTVVKRLHATTDDM